MLFDAEDFITLSEAFKLARHNFFPHKMKVWLNVSHKHFSHTNQMKSSRVSVSQCFLLIFYPDSLEKCASMNKPPKWAYICSAILCGFQLKWTLEAVKHQSLLFPYMQITVWLWAGLSITQAMHLWKRITLKLLSVL